VSGIGRSRGLAQRIKISQDAGGPVILAIAGGRGPFPFPALEGGFVEFGQTFVEPDVKPLQPQLVLLHGPAAVIPVRVDWPCAGDVMNGAGEQPDHLVRPDFRVVGVAEDVLFSDNESLRFGAVFDQPCKRVDGRRP